MRASRVVSCTVLVWVMVFFFFSPVSSPVAAQVSAERVQAAKARLKQASALLQKLPGTTRKGISGAAHNLLKISEDFHKPDGPREPPSLTRPAAAPIDPAAAPGAGLAAIRVSDPAADGVFSVVAGFTQSETSTGWCGSNVVVGFNDSGSLLESLFFGPGGLSFNGYARSTDAGVTYTDMGFLNPGSDPDNFLLGDPVVSCADPTTFRYASLFFTDDAVGNPVSAISVSTSTDGGASFADPEVAAGKSAFTHFLDKPWFTVDPNDGDNLYVTYTDFDFSGVCGIDPIFGPITRVAIEFVRSTDGGANWSTPMVIQEVCSPPTVPGLFVQGSQIAVGPGGEVYVGWEFYDADFVTRTLRIRKSTNNGLTFGGPVDVTAVDCVGECFVLQGGFRAFLDLGGIAADRSGGPTNGHVYLTYQSGGFSVFDAAAADGSYSYGDIFLRKSTDGGATWGPAVKVNNNPDPVPGGGGTDQFMPYVAVDKNGRVAVSFYDRRRDGENFFIDRFTAFSVNGGATWVNARETPRGFPAIHATDTFINPLYMGDYDVVTSDATQANLGFVGAYQVITPRGNPDVVAHKR
jgi:hypothetical protein